MARRHDQRLEKHGAHGPARWLSLQLPRWGSSPATHDHGESETSGGLKYCRVSEPSSTNMPVTGTPTSSQAVASTAAAIAEHAGTDTWKTWAGRKHGDDTFQVRDLVNGVAAGWRHMVRRRRSDKVPPSCTTVTPTIRHSLTHSIHIKHPLRSPIAFPVLPSIYPHSDSHYDVCCVTTFSSASPSMCPHESTCRDVRLTHRSFRPFFFGLPFPWVLISRRMFSGQPERHVRFVMMETRNRMQSGSGGYDYVRWFHGFSYPTPFPLCPLRPRPC